MLLYSLLRSPLSLLLDLSGSAGKAIISSFTSLVIRLEGFSVIHIIMAKAAGAQWSREMQLATQFGTMNDTPLLVPSLLGLNNL